MIRRAPCGFVLPVGIAVVLAAALTGCAGPDRARAPLQVFAASSLAEAFEAMAAAFEAEQEGTSVALTPAGSQVLRLQIEQGAPADVFASASTDHMEALIDAGLVRDDVAFAYNELAIIVPPDNPAGVRSFGDLARARRLVVGVAAVPVGQYTRRMLDRARRVFGSGFADSVEAAVVSEESNVRLVRAKVELGEADAAIVYRTDAAATAGVRTVEIPASVNVRATYRMGITARSGTTAAGAWIRFVRSDRGRAILERHGFRVTP